MSEEVVVKHTGVFYYQYVYAQFCQFSDQAGEPQEKLAYDLVNTHLMHSLMDALEDGRQYNVFMPGPYLSKDGWEVKISRVIIVTLKDYKQAAVGECAELGDDIPYDTQYVKFKVGNTIMKFKQTHWDNREIRVQYWERVE